MTFGPTVLLEPDPTVTPVVEVLMDPNVRADCLLLKVLQSVEDNLPVFVADATGRFRVSVVPTDVIPKSVPAVPVTRDKAPVKELIEVTPPADPFEAAVMRPLESTVILVLVYDPGVTAVFASVAVAEPGPFADTSPVSAVI